MMWNPNVVTCDGKLEHSLNVYHSNIIGNNCTTISENIGMILNLFVCSHLVTSSEKIRFGLGAYQLA